MLDEARLEEREPEVRADDHVHPVHYPRLHQLFRAARIQLLGVLEDEADLPGELTSPSG